MQIFSTYLQALFHLLYPKICVLCGQQLSKSEELICLPCSLKLPYTNFHQLEESPLDKKFWGRIQVEFTDSLLFFEKASPTQHLLYQLKYNNRPEIGDFLAQKCIDRYINNSIFGQFDVISYVPLHPKKQKIRLYNQCHSFCLKLSQHYKIALLPDLLIKEKHTSSQTGKNRMDRWYNVEKSFRLNKTHSIQGKHILLVDDVLTTGATLEACGSKILNVSNVKLSILTMACKL